jgi:hypothetical protein
VCGWRLVLGWTEPRGVWGPHLSCYMTLDRVASSP